ncbi:hypothetical protein [Nocardia sp. NPDC050710]|uniref:hypothetical protein n=1 Tax=Nocardia sp. NPDC050710 TaxID=3157220 RepID=UPI0033D937F6
MTEFVTRAQIVLLARTLHVPADRLAHLEKLGATQLHELQQRMASVIFEEHAATFKRLSMLVPVVPLSISIPLVQRIVPPLIAGRAAGAVGVDHPKKAADAVGMLDPGFAADCAPYIDPHTVGELADVAPPEPIARIADELMRRADYVTAGPFLAYATPQLIRAVETGVPDDEGLIRSAAYAFSGSNISSIVRELLGGPAQRIPRIARTVLAGSAELQLAAVSVFARCDEDVIASVGDILFDIGAAEDITAMAAAIIDAGAVPELLRFVGHLSPSALDILAANPITADETRMAAVIAVLDGRAEPALWRGLVNLLERTAAGLQRGLIRQVIALPEPTLVAMAAAGTAAHLWPSLLRVLADADMDSQTRLGEIWAKLPPEERDAVERRVHELHLDTRLATLTVTLNIYG